MSTDQFLQMKSEEQSAVSRTDSRISREEPPAGGFLTVFAHLLREGRDRLRRGLAELQKNSPDFQPVDPVLVEAMLYETFQAQLERMVSRTLALELNIARLQGSLQGETPAERYADFIEQFRQPERVRALADEYPVLFRLAEIRINAWVESSLEMIARIHSDLGEIRATFAAGVQPGRIVGITGAKRNTRRRGRKVVIFTFESGLKIVYKPRSLSVERHFQELLDWLNQDNQQPAFRLLKLLDRGSYGWMEWLSETSCASQAEVRRFYRRQGAYLALLYALEAADFHLDNIIAVGEHPMLIDLEALFHPRDAEPELLPLEMALDRATYHSVLRPGLLPEPEWGDGQSTGFDLSGLAGWGEQRTPYPVPTWEGKGTDTMRLVRRPATIPPGKNLPILQDSPVSVMDCRKAFEQGFVRMYRRIIRRRPELLHPDGMLARFAQDEIRILPRSGKYYGTLLDMSFHPDLMHDAADREQFFDRLWEAVEYESYLARLIPFEKADLLGGEVPLFTTLADSRDAWSSAGQRIEEYFPWSGLEAARQRIAALSEDDLGRQRWLMQAALATAVKQKKKRAANLKHVAGQPEASTPSRQRMLDLARAIGEQLHHTALRGDEEVSWLGVALVEDRHWEIRSLELDVFNGLPGVILYLARLGEVTGEDRWMDLARSATRPLQRYLDEDMKAGEIPSTGPGILSGWGGVLFSLAHLGTCWRKPDLLQTARELCARVAERATEIEACDLGHGKAGSLVGLLALHRVCPDRQVLNAGLQLGDSLMQSDPEISIKAPRLEQPFAAFWHGRLGVAWALLELARLTGKSRYKQAALSMADLELASDLGSTGPDASGAQECVPGIALGCLRVLPYVGDAARRSRLGARIEAALETMLRCGFGRNHTLGFGDMGCLEVLLQANEFLDHARWRECYAKETARVVAEIGEHGWSTAIPLGVESPGLMTGLSGIGYGLLRLADPDRVPSALALELPRR